VAPLELDALFDLRDGVVDETDSLDSMPSLVGVRHLELLPRGPKVLERRLHVRLVGERARREKAARDGDRENEKSGGAASGQKPKNP
jgi:hypothetical protein